MSKVTKHNRTFLANYRPSHRLWHFRRFCSRGTSNNIEIPPSSDTSVYKSLFFIYLQAFYPVPIASSIPLLILLLLKN